MRSILVSIAVVFAFLVCSAPLAAKEWPLDVPKGATVVVKVPIGLWESKEGPSLSTGAPIFTIETSDTLARRDWQTAGLPYFGEFTVTKIFEFKPFYKVKYTDVELRNNTTWVKLRFPAGSDIGSGFKDLTFAGGWNQFEVSDYFKKVVFGEVGSRIFTGPLASVPDVAKLSLLRIAGIGLATLSSESFKGKVFIVFSFPLPATVYNSLKVNEEARAATVMNSRLALIKSFAELASGTAIQGVKIEQSILFRDFSSDAAPTKQDRIEVYAPIEAVNQFSSADITSQQLMDDCVIILNDNRIHLSLANAI